MYEIELKASFIVISTRILLVSGDFKLVQADNTDYDKEKTSLWLLGGNTQPTEVNEKIVLQWVDYMVTAGWNYGCYFDGWGAEIP